VIHGYVLIVFVQDDPEPSAPVETGTTLLHIGNLGGEMLSCGFLAGDRNQQRHVLAFGSRDAQMNWFCPK